MTFNLYEKSKRGLTRGWLWIAKISPKDSEKLFGPVAFGLSNLFIHFSECDLFGYFSLPIALWVFHWSYSIFDSQICEELLNSFVNELLSIIGCQSVGNYETLDNIFPNEFFNICYWHGCCGLCLNPLCEMINANLEKFYLCFCRGGGGGFKYV